MIRLKSKADIEKMRASGAILVRVFEAVAPMMRPGISTATIDRIAHELIVEAGATPSCLGYESGGPTPFPTATCISVNDEIVHGFPSETEILEEGMIVSLDVCACLDGFHTDAARTYTIGEVDPRARELVEVTEQAFFEGLKEVRLGKRLGDVGAAVQTWCEAHGFGVVRELTGHGVGYELHEDPDVPNYGRRGRGLRIRPGMTFALEPMVTLGSRHISVAKNGWTIMTADGLPAAHYENTLAITEDGVEILTL
ncbi:MAG: type I methionyl aminopeptidase [Clostridiaceae bacterium]|nr:type I methionyl aminopeptidase [Clostridiaceae bacterium]